MRKARSIEDNSLEFDEASQTLKALGHPVRLRIAASLCCDSSCNVNGIAEKLGLPQSTVSQHLGVLRNNGILTPRKTGVQTCYEVTDERAKRLLLIYFPCLAS
jgi:ArsR family transcriptional regulator